MKQNLRIPMDLLLAAFVPFLAVLFIEFVLRLGMGPAAEEVSLLSPVFASLIGICSFIWIKRGIILGFIPIFAGTVLMLVLEGSMSTLRLRFFYFFFSFLLLTFVSMLVFAMAEASRKRGGSRGRTIALFFIGILAFVTGMGLIDFLFGFLNPDLGMVQALLLGVRSGLMLGCGVSVVVLLLSQRNT